MEENHFWITGELHKRPADGTYFVREQDGTETDLSTLLRKATPGDGRQVHLHFRVFTGPDTNPSPNFPPTPLDK